jgi:hypothetical protein
LVEARPQAVRPGEAAVGVNPFRVNAEFDQGGALRSEILLVGRTARVTDQSHAEVYVKGRSCSKRSYEAG